MNLLPSLEQIERMEKKRSEAIESLEISDGRVKCQKCCMAVPSLETSKTTKPNGFRIATLQMKIKWIEEHYNYFSSYRTREEAIQALKQELAELLEEEAEAEALRRLPLYSCKITGYRYVCSTCFSKISNHRRRRD
jgi:tRNA-dihydrouridine synthase